MCYVVDLNTIIMYDVKTDECINAELLSKLYEQWTNTF